MFEEITTRLPDHPGFMYKKEGRYVPITYREFRRNVYRLARWLLAQGIAKGDRVALLSNNRPEWPLSDMAILLVGGVNVPVYPTLEAEQTRHLLDHSESRLIFVEDGKQLAKVLEVWKDLPALEGVVVFDPPSGSLPERVIALEEALGAEELSDEEYEQIRRRAGSITPDDLASIVYTSGTTGVPKGVMLSHGNFMSNVDSTLSVVDLSEKDVSLSFLPLSHSLERTAGYYGLMARGATIAYAESIQTVPENMQEVRPTIVISVPRLYEKMYAKIQARLATAPAFRKALFDWAIGVGKRREELKRQGRTSVLNALQDAVAEALVFKKLKALMGGRLRFFVSGGAPLEKSIAEFFAAAGILILEGYGLTETSPVTNCNRPDAYRFGTVGPTIPGVQVRIAEDGEILVKGPNVMKGYFKMPEETAAVFTEDGWFKTGDIGEIDSDGFLRITDRKKELIVTSGGKNVPRAPIENMLKTSPHITQAMCVGDKRKFIGALIVPDWERVKETLGEPAAAKPPEELVDDPAVIELIQREVDRVNEKLPRYERIKRFKLVPREWLQETGELTPTLKLKRRVILKKFADEIEGIYAET
jgi:long-chain acyl-CoA synthetase